MSFDQAAFDRSIYSELRAIPGLDSLPIRPDVADQGDIAPYVVYTRLPLGPNWTLTGPSSLQNAHYQIDVYAKSRADAIRIAGLVTQALSQSQLLTGVPKSESSDYEPDTKLYRRMLEFSVWLNA